MKKLFYTLLIIGTFTALNFFSSCKDSMVYDSYSHTPIAGWEKTTPCRLIFHLWQHRGTIRNI